MASLELVTHNYQMDDGRAHLAWLEYICGHLGHAVVCAAARHSNHELPETEKNAQCAYEGSSRVR